MSAVGELVQGERRGRWLVAAVACAAAMAWAAAPARAADCTIPGHAADHLRQRHRPAAGRLQRQRDRRVLPAVAGAGQRGAQRARRSARTARAHRLRLPGVGATRCRTRPPVASAGPRRRTAVRASPYTLTHQHHRCQLLHRRRRVLTYVNGTTDVGRPATRFVAVRQPGRLAALYEAADLYVAGNDAGVGLPRPRPAPPGRRHQRGAGSSARLVRAHAVGPLPGGALRQRRVQRRGQHDASAPIQRHDRLRRSLDNGVGVQWDITSLASSAPARPSHTTWRFQPLLAARRSPCHGGARSQGQTATVDGHGAQQRRQPGPRPLGALRDRRRQPGRAAR